MRFHSKARTLFIYGALSIFFVGCAGLKTDYLPPQTGPKAHVKITTSYPGINLRIYIHGDNICDFNQTKLVGLLYSKTLGIPYQDALDIVVPCNKETVISTTTFTVAVDAQYVRSTWSHPVFTFKPEPSKFYKIELGYKAAKIYYLANELDPNSWVETSGIRLDTTCAFSSEDLGKSGRPFFLKNKE